MRVTLRLLDGLSSDEGLLKVHELTERPFVIGRSPDAHWTIVDPSNRVSGAHVELRCKGEDVVLVDLSSGGTGLNSAANRLVRDQPVNLPDDCKLVLPVGAISVSIERENLGPLGQTHEKDDFFSLGEVRRERSRRQPEGPRANPAALLLDDEPVNPLRAPASTAPAAFDAESSSVSRDGENQGGARLLNPGDLLDGGSMPSTRQPAPDLAPRSVGVPDRVQTDLGTPSRPAHAPEPLDHLAEPKPRRGSSWIDDDDEEDNPFGSSDPTETAEMATETTLPLSPTNNADSVSAVAAESEPASPTGNPNLSDVKPPQSHEDVTQDAAASQMEERPSGSAASEEALDMLLAQLGVPMPVSDEEKIALVSEIGRTFTSMADAMRQMLATRAEVKRALGIVATEIEIGANPLKTARDKTAAIDGLIRPLSSGFLSGEAAVEDSLHSMQAHQYAMVSGIKAALQKTLDAFNPDTLEEKMTRRGLASWLPGQRKAALWDSFVTNYDMFSEQAAENFRMLIGRELDNLYQTRREQISGRTDDETL